jgi:isopenicillin N synthase-like dioxygenase
MTTIPVLDLSLLDRGAASADAFRAHLRTATHEVGFFSLIGHGIPDEIQADLHRVSRAFFDLSEADKLAIENIHSPQFLGYTRVGGERTEGAVDWREQIDLGPDRPAVDLGADDPAYLRLEGPNQWPTALPEFREVLTRWRESLTGIAERLLHAWSESLGAPADALDSAFGDRPSTLIKVVRYPGKADGQHQGVGGHKDSGVLTLLWVEPGKGGLQVQVDGEWIDIPSVPGALVVNIGELLEWATGGYLTATVHRVVSPKLGDDRISVPFFYNPHLAATVPRLELPPALAAQARGVAVDPSNPIHGTYGENSLKSRLRSHPDVAALHHADLLVDA